ncbi:hypothetical protein C8J56DRAFT_881050 [Mycena floridula]|nr:hypothetical protein C8J56DRAFT_881050 [Mycena floridula]
MASTSKSKRSVAKSATPAKIDEASTSAQSRASRASRRRIRRDETTPQRQFEIDNPQSSSPYGPQRSGDSTYIDGVDPGDVMYQDTDRDLSLDIKLAINRLIAIYGPADRSLISQELIVQFCHLMEKSMDAAQVEVLKNHWKREKLDLSAVDNIIKERPTDHWKMDHAFGVVIPQLEVIEEIHNLWFESGRSLTAEDFDKFFEIPDKKEDFHDFQYLPLLIDSKECIFRHKLEQTGERTWIGTGEYEIHRWPYTTLTVKTHANVFYAIWHAGREIARLTEHQFLAAMKDLPPDLQVAINFIAELYEAWVLPAKSAKKDKKKKGKGVEKVQVEDHEAEPDLPAIEQTPRASATEKAALIAQKHAPAEPILSSVAQLGPPIAPLGDTDPPISMTIVDSLPLVSLLGRQPRFVPTAEGEAAPKTDDQTEKEQESVGHLARQSQTFFPSDSSSPSTSTRTSLLALMKDEAESLVETGSTHSKKRARIPSAELPLSPDDSPSQKYVAKKQKDSENEPVVDLPPNLAPDRKPIVSRYERADSFPNVRGDLGGGRSGTLDRDKNRSNLRQQEKDAKLLEDFGKSAAASSSSSRRLPTGSAFGSNSGGGPNAAVGASDRSGSLCPSGSKAGSRGNRPLPGKFSDETKKKEEPED